VTLDPFGDFATEGYLRNFEKEKDLAIVKRAENASFTTGLDEAFASLAKAKTLSYDDVLKSHGILFRPIYPWAGQDRTQTAPKLTIKKGPVIFANAPEIRAAVEFALRKGQDKDYMKAGPGEIMGYLAYGHPFLDGNGRTIMTVHSVLAQRAGFSIDWAATKKDASLKSLIHGSPASKMQKFLGANQSTFRERLGLGQDILGNGWHGVLFCQKYSRVSDKPKRHNKLLHYIRYLTETRRSPKPQTDFGERAAAIIPCGQIRDAARERPQESECGGGPRTGRSSMTAAT
jgi:cell filamentation protein